MESFSFTLLAVLAVAVLAAAVATRTATRQPGPPPGPPVLSLPTRLGGRHALASAAPTQLVGVALLGCSWIALPLFGLAESFDHAGGPWTVVGFAAAWIVASVVLLRARRHAQRRGPYSIELYGDRLTVPRGAVGLPPVTVWSVRLGDVRGVRPAVTGDGLVIETSTEAITVSAPELLQPTDLGALYRALAERVGELPGEPGPDEAVVRDGTLLWESRPRRATHALVAVLGLVFALELLAGLEQSPDGTLVRFGAASAALVRGEWARLLVASLLHANVWPLLVNALWLTSFGVLVELAVGSAWFVLIGLGAGAIGMLMAAPLDFVPSGASAICAGLLGALLVLARREDAIPASVRVNPGLLVRLLLMSALVPAIAPVGWVAHIGATLFGALVAFAAPALEDGVDGGERTERGAVRSGAMAFVALHVIALGLTLRNAEARRDHWLPVLEAAEQRSPGSAGALNELSWSVAIDPDATMADLESAVRLLAGLDAINNGAGANSAEH